MQVECELVKKDSIAIFKNNETTETRLCENVYLFTLAFFAQCIVIITINSMFGNFIENEMMKQFFGGFSSVISYLHYFSIFLGTLFVSKAWVSFAKWKKSECAVEAPLVEFIVGLFLYALPALLIMAKDIPFSA